MFGTGEPTAGGAGPKQSPDRSELVAFLDMMYGYLDPGDENHAYCIALRGLGEKGTPGEGVFMDVQIVPPLRSSFDVDLIFGHMQRWAKHGRAVFIVPAAVAPSALSDNKATEDRIFQFTTLLVDIDSGDTGAKLTHGTKYLGEPSMVVHSGGTTELGKPKMHIYWRLTEPSADVQRIAQARKLLALKIGGDAAFGRATQVIRIPGSIYSKGGMKRVCRIAAKCQAEYDVNALLQALEDMPVMEGVTFDPAKLPALAVAPFATGGGLDFSAFKAARADLVGDKPDIAESLNSDIAEGGDIDRNRWGEFSRVAGLYIKHARDGLITADNARGMTEAWMMLHMKPPWPPARFASEFDGLVKLDARHHGPIIEGSIIDFSKHAPNNPNVNPAPAMVERLDGTRALPTSLEDWDYGNYAEEEIPTRRFLVRGLVQAGTSCLIAAEGGAGKTFLLLDLATKIALHEPGSEQSWCGMPLADDAGGTVVMFTTEDDKRELQIRLADILTRDQRRRLKELRTLKIVPTVNAGGAFPLVERNRSQGPARTGEVWQAYLDQLEAYSNLKVVMIDTLNSTMHGEENSATVINEYVQAASAHVCGKLDAALIVTHHVRKSGGNVRIYTPEDMKNSIRGSTALIGAFRAVLGVWHAPDHRERLIRLGEEAKPGQLYNFAVVKGNNPELDYGMRALLRKKSGLLVDVTEREQKIATTGRGEVEAWAVKAVAYAAEAGHPFSIRAFTRMPDAGRKHQLPALLRVISEAKLTELCKRLIETNRLVQCNPQGRTNYNYLDVPDGSLARANGKDNFPFKVQTGADFTAPDWERDFSYHVVEGRIVDAGHEHDRTVLNPNCKSPATDTPDEHAPGTPGTPPIPEE